MAVPKLPFSIPTLRVMSEVKEMRSNNIEGASLSTKCFIFLEPLHKDKSVIACLSYKIPNILHMCTKDFCLLILLNYILVFVNFFLSNDSFENVGRE